MKSFAAPLVCSHGLSGTNRADVGPGSHVRGGRQGDEMFLGCPARQDTLAALSVIVFLASPLTLSLQSAGRPQSGAHTPSTGLLTQISAGGGGGREPKTRNPPAALACHSSLSFPSLLCSGPCVDPAPHTDAAAHAPRCDLTCPSGLLPLPRCPSPQKASAGPHFYL